LVIWSIVGYFVILVDSDLNEKIQLICDKKQYFKFACVLFAGGPFVVVCVSCVFLYLLMKWIIRKIAS